MLNPTIQDVIQQLTRGYQGNCRFKCKDTIYFPLICHVLFKLNLTVPENHKFDTVEDAPKDLRLIVMKQYRLFITYVP